MSSIKLLSELVAWRNLTLKEETPERIIFELWDKANWDEVAKGIYKDNLLGDLTTLILLLAASFIILFVIPRPWGLITFIASIVAIAVFVTYRVRLHQKNKLVSPPHTIFDRGTGFATGISIDFSTFKSMPWQIEIKQIDSLSLKWDDPRFDMAMLEVLDSNGLLLCAFFGRSNDLRQSADLLKTWLRVKLRDEIEK